jgi:hypothetical protein
VELDHVVRHSACAVQALVAHAAFEMACSLMIDEDLVIDKPAITVPAILNRTRTLCCKIQKKAQKKASYSSALSYQQNMIGSSVTAFLFFFFGIVESLSTSAQNTKNEEIKRFCAAKARVKEVSDGSPSF